MSLAYPDFLCSRRHCIESIFVKFNCLASLESFGIYDSFETFSYWVSSFLTLLNLLNIVLSRVLQGVCLHLTIFRYLLKSSILNQFSHDMAHSEAIMFKILNIMQRKSRKTFLMMKTVFQILRTFQLFNLFKTSNQCFKGC